MGMPFYTQGDCCPSCGAVLDAATAIDGSSKRPKTGDFSVCVYCGAALRWDEPSPSTIGLRVATQVDLDELDDEMAFQFRRACALVRANLLPMPERPEMHDYSDKGTTQ